MSLCKSCQAEIEWALTTNGKKVPLDPEPITVAVTQDDGSVMVVTGRQAHFATCPNASKHRKPRERRKPAEEPCGMCEKPCGPGVPGSAVVGAVVLCSRTCLQAHRAKQAVERRANKCD